MEEVSRILAADLFTSGPERKKPTILSEVGSTIAELMLAIWPDACILRIGVPMRRLAATNIPLLYYVC